MVFPETPSPVRLDLPARDTVLLVLDLSSRALQGVFNASGSIANLKRLVEKAREAKVLVFYTITMRLGTDIIEEVKPRLYEDRIVETYGADKFYNTQLEYLLRSKGTRFLVMTGAVANGAVLYTAFEAIMRGLYPVVVADCILAETQEIYDYSLWQLLNSPGRSNPRNIPLAPFAATMTKSDDLTFF